MLGHSYVVCGRLQGGRRCVVPGIAMAHTLNQSDVTRLLDNPTPEARAETAGKVAQQFAGGSLSPAEREIAEDIFRQLVEDAETRVREALAEHVKDAENLPHDVALKLAQDTDSVAEPILRFSTALTDSDLIDIVQNFGPSKQVAVARRQTVSSAVSEALVETDNEDAVVALVENKGADISERSLDKVVDKYGENQRFHAPLVQRNELPVSIAERLVSMVSERLQDHLVANHDLPPSVAADLALQSRERATMGLVSGSGEAAAELVDHLASQGRLTPTLMLRAMCMGDTVFFEIAMARLAGVPLLSARLLIHDSGGLGLKSLYDKGGLPELLYPAFRVAVDVARETELDGGDDDLARYSRTMIERILTQYQDIGADNLDYLLTRLSKLSSPQSQAAE